MKKLLYLIALVLCSGALPGQTLTESETTALRARLQTFADLNKAEDYEHIVDLFYPKLLEASSREHMIKQFTAMEEMGVDIIMDSLSISKMEAVHRTTDDLYALGTCDMKMRIVLKSVPSESYMVSTLKGYYGKDNVSYEADTKTVTIRAPKYMVGINEKAYGNEWYFLEYDVNNNSPIYAILGNVIGEKIVNKAK